MTDRPAQSRLTQRRGQLLLELFLEDLNPLFATRSDADDFPYDYLVGFTNPRGGVNTYAVQLKATDGPVPARYPVPRSVHDRLANSNLPGLLVVVDAKADRLFYGWPTEASTGPGGRPMLRLTEVTPATKSDLRARLIRADTMPAAVA